MSSIHIGRSPIVRRRLSSPWQSIFPAYPGNSAPAVWPQNSPGSAVGVREIFGDDTFGDPADNRRVEPASKYLSWTDDNLLRQVVYEGLREETGGRRGSPAGAALTT